MKKLSDLLLYVVIAAGGWWLWTGPIHDMRTVSADEQLKINADNMAHCMAGEDFAANATGESRFDPEQHCAKRYNLYRENGVWYRHDQPRPAGGTPAHADG